MRTAICKIHGIGTYGQSAPIKSLKNTQETNQAFEERTWLERCNVGEEGEIVIPAQAFKNSLLAAAKYLGLKIQGKGQSTYSKHFAAGIMISNSVSLGVTPAKMKKKTLFVPSDGKVGGGSRVWKNFPYVEQWDGTLKIVILDDIIGDEIFQKHLETAGQFVGVGFWRPERNGDWGRFQVDSIKFTEGVAVA